MTTIIAQRREALRSRLLVRLGAFLVSAALLVSLVVTPPKAKAAFTEAGLLSSLIITYMVAAGIVVSPGESFERFLGPYISDFEQTLSDANGKIINFLGYDSYADLFSDIIFQTDFPTSKYVIFIPRALSLKLAEFVEWFQQQVFADAAADPVTGEMTITLPVSSVSALPKNVFDQYVLLRNKYGSAAVRNAPMTYGFYFKWRGTVQASDQDVTWYTVCVGPYQPISDVIIDYDWDGITIDEYYVKYDRVAYNQMFLADIGISSDSSSGFFAYRIGDLNPQTYEDHTRCWLPFSMMGGKEYLGAYTFDPVKISEAIPTPGEVTITRPGTISYPVDREGERDTVLTVPAGDYAVPKDPAVPDGDLITIPGLGEGIGSIGELLEGILERIDTIPVEGAIAEEAVKPEEPRPEPEDIDGLGLPTLAALLTTRFPFSIPWDLGRSVELLSAPAQVPVFEVDFMAPISKRVGGWKGSTKITLDFSQFETLAALCRWTSTVGFCFFLVGATKRYIWTA